jgi:hypothetical protein
VGKINMWYNENKNMEYITVDGSIYPVTSDIARYFYNATDNTVKSWIDGTEVKYVVQTKTGNEVCEFDLENASDSEVEAVLEMADVSPVNSKIISLTQELPGKARLDEWA